MAITFPEIDPFAIRFTETVGIRWYALAYLAGILGGLFYSSRLADLDRDRRPAREDIDNVLPWIVLGIVLGGRLGYTLFYNLNFYLRNPADILRLWEGGMSFHGGLLGVALACILYARRHGFSPLALGDLIAAAAPIGLFFGRLANFVNGELFGRITTAPWGVVFPHGGELPRHPSQIYEAALEGLLLFVLLWITARNPRLRRAPGFLLGLFLLGYGLCRMFVEMYREPDAQIGFLLGSFSLGQVLCLPMAVLGALLIRHARHRA